MATRLDAFAETLARYDAALPATDSAALRAWLSTFHPFQLEWLLEPAEQAICNKARQIGLSHTTSALGVVWGAFHGETTTIISVGELESAEVLAKARLHAEVLQRLGSGLARMTRRSAIQVAFASGGRILALPSTGGRSFSGNVFLDEYAYQEHAAEVWDSAAAVTLLGGNKLRVVSTPNGVGNEFERLWTRSASDPETMGGWARHEISIDRAIADGYPVDIAKCWALAKGDARLFDQLFRCQFLDGAAQYLPTTAVNACSSDELYSNEGEYYAGLDIGRSVDRTVLIVVRALPDGRRFVQHIETCKRTSSDALEAMVARAFATFRLRRLCVDSSGLGAFPAERMQRKHGIHRVEPVVFTQAVKEDLATTLYSAFTENMVRIPLTDALGFAPGSAAGLRRDLCSIRREITSAGNVRYDAPHTDEGHADAAWALALALYSCSKAAGQRHTTGGR